MLLPLQRQASSILMSNCSNCSSCRVSSPGAGVARSIMRLNEQAEQGQGLIEYGFTCELCVCRAAACLAQNSRIAAPQWHVEDDFPAEPSRLEAHLARPRPIRTRRTRILRSSVVLLAPSCRIRYLVRCVSGCENAIREVPDSGSGAIRREVDSGRRQSVSRWIPHFPCRSSGYLG